MNSHELERIFKENYEYMVNFASKYVLREIAEDIVVDIFINLHNNFEKLKKLKNIKAYLLTSTKNRCIDYIRTENSRRKMLIKFRTETTEDVFDDTNKELAAKIQELIGLFKILPPRTAQIAYLCYIKGFKDREIAEMLNISASTVGMTKFRARNTIRRAVTNC